jgi:hypothetical protein
MAPKNCYLVDGYRESAHPGVNCLGNSNAWVYQPAPKLGLFLRSAATIASGGRDR